MMTLKVGIIIPFYGGSGYLEKLLNSIFSDSPEMDTKVYIVDNSKAEERLSINFVNDDRVAVINTQTGIGYGKACNIGYKKCLEDGRTIAVIVNQDGYFESGALFLLVQSLVNGSNDYIAAMPLLTEYDNKNVEWFFIYVYLSKMPGMVSDLFAGKVNNYYEMPDLCGACFAIKINEFHQEFLFDPIYHMYFEDADLYKRLQLIKYKVMIVPTAIFHHTHSNTTNYENRSIKENAVYKTSSYIFSIIHSEKKFFRSILGWSVLQLKRLFENIFKLRGKELTSEFLATYFVLKNATKIYFKRYEIKFSQKNT